MIDSKNGKHQNTTIHGSTFSLASNRVTFTGALRILSHGSLIVRSLREGRYRTALILGSASIASDVFLTMRLRDPSYRPRWWQPVLDAADIAMWCQWGPPGLQTVLQASTAVITPTAAETAHRVLSGTQTMPVYDDREHWPPDDFRDAIRKLARVAIPVLVPVAVVRMGRQVGRLSARDRLSLLIPGLCGALLAGLGARQRARLQGHARERWWDRTSSQIAQERIEELTNLVTSSTVGHDFKKTLFALGSFGSAAAWDAAQRQAQRPVEVMSESDGATLRSVVKSIRIEPLDAQRLWIGATDTARIERFLDLANAQAVDGADQTLRVAFTDTRSTELRYLGSTLLLVNEPSPLLANLYPTSAGLMLSAFWKVSSVVPAWRGLPPPIAIGTALVDVALARVVWRTPPNDAVLRRILVIASVNNFVGLVLSATQFAPERTATGDPSLAGNQYLVGSAMLLSSHWARVSNVHRAMLPSFFLLWVVTGQIRRRVPALHVLGEAFMILVPVVAAWRFTDRIEGEVALVEHALAREFAVACDEARAQVIADEKDEFRVQLDIARRALADLGDVLDSSTRHQLDAECRALEIWIDSPNC